MLEEPCRSCVTRSEQHCALQWRMDGRVKALTSSCSSSLGNWMLVLVLCDSLVRLVSSCLSTRYLFAPGRSSRSRTYWMTITRRRVMNITPLAIKWNVLQAKRLFSNANEWIVHASFLRERWVPRPTPGTRGWRTRGMMVHFRKRAQDTSLRCCALNKTDK